jgi:hypothetical protein
MTTDQHAPVDPDAVVLAIVAVLVYLPTPLRLVKTDRFG